MNAIQRKSAPAAATAKSASKNNFRLHITTPLPLCQILRGAAGWASFTGLLGVAGGMEQGTISFLPGCFWMTALLILLDWGSKPWQR